MRGQTRFTIRLIGKIWMPMVEAATELNVTDWDLRGYDSFEMNIDDIERYMTSHSGDFSQILDYEITVYDYPICPTCNHSNSKATVIHPWKDGEDSYYKWVDCMYPCEEEETI